MKPLLTMILPFLFTYGDAYSLGEAGVYSRLFQAEGSSDLGTLGMGFFSFHLISSFFLTQSLVVPFQSRNHDSGVFEGI